MAVSPKIIKRRIRSVSNTKKITKAMELVSAAKMRKAVARTLASRAYAGTAWELVQRLTMRVDYQHPLLGNKQDESTYSSSDSDDASEESRSSRQARTVNKTAVIVISSNRGLCGSFNARIAGEALKMKDVEYITMGRKSRDIIRRNGATIAADFEKKDITTSIADLSPLTRLVMDGFLDGTYSRVSVVYMDFISSLVQQSRVKQLLPFIAEEDENLGVIGTSPRNLTPTLSSEEREKLTKRGEYEYLIEPAPDVVLNDLLPRLVELQLYQSVLESEASEHSARMLAMRNATDAAGDMMQELTLMYNQARQAGITREIAEIAGGKAALEN
ncbi:ATP synthase F1 subunit gamma [Candidatus Uhrbacteria bacterium]|nr:ATP synthase F1 subunit gamma [Candidatus Uhrbacteria bacterium]